ncbi:SUMF1/EgtB/PvdO family nonheme iron enzyme [Methylobacterium sp. E-065]|uniref:selenoneine synthase SenA n=1 Tax=Methylobacterium sp. E-065 TaxID=2836583 RepID=UPI001FB9D840|nr:selenoneine synthase SenA [Methylobacterium sp. E-065]MCJ2018261.1 SUMF1/EgtB/PvdO family nonheme iron enzyme [Methylobacterium sp. E-065]
MSAQASTAELVAMLKDARARTLELVSGLDQDRLMGPQSAIVNPLLWEIGHLAWFHEHFILRGLDRAPPRLATADGLYDSARVPHATRWSISLPELPDTLAYMARVQEALVRRLDGREPTAQEAELYQLVTFHEDMHDEAFTYTRQTLGYPRPSFATSASAQNTGTGPWPGDVAVGGGTWQLGAEPGGGFVFDNEKWAHPVAVAAFRIARAPVTNREFAAFVADSGYRNPDCWDDEGARWRDGCGAEHPVYWTRHGRDDWTCRRFDRDEPFAPDQPVVHVSWYEANAYCRWAGRRLPTEAEWEAAAAGTPASDGTLSGTKHIYPWGDGAPTPQHANLDGGHLGCVDVAAFPQGDSAWGCRQMLGNVWEWTASPFLPFPGFAPHAYKEYSEPAFGTRKVLRGGAWATRARMIDTAYRNFFGPERRDVFAGFRTVAL